MAQTDAIVPGTRTDSQTGPQAVTMAATVTASRILSALVIA
jgi:hypothetical protein